MTLLNRRPKNRRKQSSQRRFQFPEIAWGKLAWTAVSLGAVLGVVAVITWAFDQPIQRIELAGRFQRVSPMEIERAVKTRVRGSGLVSVKLDDVREAIDGLPWVDTVSVERSWPRGLRVFVVEQVPAARWGDKGLLNTRGELFASDATHVPLELPQLSGPEGTEVTVAQRYLAAQGRLAEAGMRLTALRLDARGAWELDLDNGVTVRLGRKQVDERFETFMATAQKIVSQRATDIAYIDLRYSNGFAIGWRGADSRPASQISAPANGNIREAMKTPDEGGKHG
jgi:cell division protein FtsQ